MPIGYCANNGLIPNPCLDNELFKTARKWVSLIICLEVKLWRVIYWFAWLSLIRETYKLCKALWRNYKIKINSGALQLQDKREGNSILPPKRVEISFYYLAHLFTFKISITRKEKSVNLPFIFLVSAISLLCVKCKIIKDIHITRIEEYTYVRRKPKVLGKLKFCNVVWFLVCQMSIKTGSWNVKFKVVLRARVLQSHILNWNARERIYFNYANRAAWMSIC